MNLNIKNNKFYVLALLVYFVSSLYFVNIDKDIVVADSRENLNIAYNIYYDQSFSYSINYDEINKTNFREPLYPFIISILITVLPFELNTFNELLGNVKYLKLINIFFLFILSLIFLLISKDLKINEWVERASILLILFGIYFSSINTFLTEVLAAIFLLLHSYFYFKFHTNKQVFFLLISSFALILLIFTKSVFYYWAIIYFIINIYFIIIFKIKLKKLLIYLLIFSLPLVWQYRNYNVFNSFEFSSKERSILALSTRVSLSKLTFKEYFFSYVYYNPFLKTIFVDKKILQISMI